MSEIKTVKFPGDTQPREIVDAAARERITILEQSGGGGSLTATDDGNGNVEVTMTGGLSVTDDGNGNVVIM